ncbi:unnamed protein product [Anisakis simplex]|uniref:Uncharacterized protein n=1 Tax=Anisakis simplex TaxID=6269 RepID=A0A0M3JAA4_ANISI|nr:unnamed protein product [Anisakis simplex]
MGRRRRPRVQPHPPSVRPPRKKQRRQKTIKGSKKILLSSLFALNPDVVYAYLTDPKRFSYCFVTFFVVLLPCFAAISLLAYRSLLVVAQITYSETCNMETLIP